MCLQTSYDKLLGKFGNPLSLTGNRLQKSVFAPCSSNMDALNLQSFLLRPFSGGFVLHPEYYTDEQDMCLKAGGTGHVKVGPCSSPYQNDDFWKIDNGRIVPVAANTNVRRCTFPPMRNNFFLIFFSALHSACHIGLQTTKQRSAHPVVMNTHSCPPFQSIFQVLIMKIFQQTCK